MAIKALLTIGYEGSSIEDFLEALVELKVDTVLDIRELPLSRKSGFSKNALSEALERVDITYRHERALGCPAQIRHRLRESGDYRRYFADFNKYLATQLEVIETVVDELDGRVALLCFERDPEFCHRRSVAEQMKELFGLKPRHVAVPA
jgi:uncharacterized protein (DUF488 family)